MMKELTLLPSIRDDLISLQHKQKASAKTKLHPLYSEMSKTHKRRLKLCESSERKVCSHLSSLIENFKREATSTRIGTSKLILLKDTSYPYKKKLTKTFFSKYSKDSLLRFGELGIRIQKRNKYSRHYKTKSYTEASRTHKTSFTKESSIDKIKSSPKCNKNKRLVIQNTSILTMGATSRKLNNPVLIGNPSKHKKTTQSLIKTPIRIKELLSLKDTSEEITTTKMLSTKFTFKTPKRTISNLVDEELPDNVLLEKELNWRKYSFNYYIGLGKLCEVYECSREYMIWLINKYHSIIHSNTTNILQDIKHIKVPIKRINRLIGVVLKRNAEEIGNRILGALGIKRNKQLIVFETFCEIRFLLIDCRGSWELRLEFMVRIFVRGGEISKEELVGVVKMIYMDGSNELSSYSYTQYTQVAAFIKANIHTDLISKEELSDFFRKNRELLDNLYDKLVSNLR